MKLTKQNKGLALPARYLDPYIHKQEDVGELPIIRYDDEELQPPKKKSYSEQWPDEPPF